MPIHANPPISGAEGAGVSKSLDVRQLRMLEATRPLCSFWKYSLITGLVKWGSYPVTSSLIR